MRISVETLKKPEWIRNFEMYDARFIKTLFIPVTPRLARKEAPNPGKIVIFTCNLRQIASRKLKTEFHFASARSLKVKRRFV